MKTLIEEKDGLYLVTLEGELDSAEAVEAAIEMESMLKPLFENQDCDVVIDCTQLEYIASSGLRILLSILKGAKAGDSRVVMKDVNDDVKNIFRLTGFIDIFAFE